MWYCCTSWSRDFRVKNPPHFIKELRLAYRSNAYAAIWTWEIKNPTPFVCNYVVLARAEGALEGHRRNPRAGPPRNLDSKQFDDEDLQSIMGTPPRNRTVQVSPSPSYELGPHLSRCNRKKVSRITLGVKFTPDSSMSSPDVGQLLKTSLIVSWSEHFAVDAVGLGHLLGLVQPS